MSLCSQQLLNEAIFSHLFCSVFRDHKKLFSHLMYGRGIILHFRFLRHDTISVLNTSSHEALINFSACYFGNFSFSVSIVSVSFFVFHFKFNTLSGWRHFSCARHLFLKNIEIKYGGMNVCCTYF